MAQLSDDCFAFGGALMSAEEALSLLSERLHPVVGEETVPLAAACGRILARDLVAERAVPPHDNAAVDGYAVRFGDLVEGAETRLRLAGRAAAGHPLGRAAPRGAAVRVFTGAAMPEGADTVLMQEDCREEAGAVVLPPGIKRGANRRLAGEDVAAGAVALSAGLRLRPQDIGLAAALGLAEIPVCRRLKVALFSTGDEVGEVGAPLAAGAVYDANRYALRAALEGLGCAVSDLGIVPDRAEAVRETLSAAAARHDAIVSSGGMSTGEEDHVRAAVEALGALHFWRLAIRPGRPLALGQVAGVPFIGLPGNPVAVMVTFLCFARPALLLLAGARASAPHRFRVAAGFAYGKKATRREYLRARLVAGPDGAPVAEKFPRDGAGILSSMVFADGLVELPEALTRLEPGTMVDFVPFSEMG